VSPVKYDLGFYIPEDILRSHRRENLRSKIRMSFLGCTVRSDKDQERNGLNSLFLSSFLRQCWVIMMASACALSADDATLSA
jgi:hypothetical protein